MSVAPRFHRLAVSDLRREAADAVSMTFTIPKELEGDYGFTPGQYLTLRTTMDGEEVRRSYSICSGPDDGELRIAVKKADGGAFSNWAADELKAGDELDVMTPTGRFGVAHAPTEARVYVGFAAGSGITPVLSIVKGVLVPLASVMVPDAWPTNPGCVAGFWSCAGVTSGTGGRK